MIISRAPLRLPLGGGGGDMPPYYLKNGTFWLSGSINRHIYIVFHNRSVQPAIKLKYTKIEETTDVNQIEHPIFRVILKKYGITKNVEITSVADVGGGTGLGSSSTFTVSLLNAIHAHLGKSVSAREIAEEAFDIEFNELKSGAGKQDSYAAALGGINAFTVDKKGVVSVERLKIPFETLREFENNLLLFFTGHSRQAKTLLSELTQKLVDNDSKAIEAMDHLKDIAHQTKKVFLSGNLSEMGSLLDDHWKTKKSAFPSISTPHIEKCYSLALKNGATGGKISGAGAGGFLMLYCPSEHQKLRKAMTAAGLTEMKYVFDPAGVKTLFNIEGEKWY